MGHRACASVMCVIVTALGCAGARRGTPTRPGLIGHPVFFQLVDAGDAAELIGDCDALIPVIPGVVSYSCGERFESGRSGVDRDFDVGLYVGFGSAADYASYVAHPNHVLLVEKWRPRLRGLLVRDVIDETP